jgi:hypothetical protein
MLPGEKLFGVFFFQLQSMPGTSPGGEHVSMARATIPVMVTRTDDYLPGQMIT